MADTGKVLPAQDCINADKDPRASIKDMLPAVKAAYTVEGKQYPASVNVSTVCSITTRTSSRRPASTPTSRRPRWPN